MKTSSWRLLKTKTKDVLKTSSRRLHQDECLLGTLRSSRWGCFANKGVVKYFTTFTGKHLCRSLFLIKPEGLQFYQRESPTQGFSSEHYEIFRSTFFEEYRNGCFWAFWRFSWKFIISSDPSFLILSPILRKPQQSVPDSFLSLLLKINILNREKSLLGQYN